MGVDRGWALEWQRGPVDGYIEKYWVSVDNGGEIEEASIWMRGSIPGKRLCDRESGDTTRHSPIIDTNSEAKHDPS